MLGLGVLAGAAGVRIFLADELDSKSALALLRSVQGEWWAAPLFVLAYIAGTALFIPALLFNVVAGAAWGFAQGVVLSFLAVNVSATLHFWVARRLGRSAVEGLLRRHRVHVFDEKAAAHGLGTVLTIRMFPLPHFAVNAAAGVSAIRWRDFALGSLIGTLPNLVVYTYLAASLVEGVAGAERRALVQAALAGLVILLLTLGVRRWTRARSPVR